MQENIRESNGSDETKFQKQVAIINEAIAYCRKKVELVKNIRAYCSTTIQRTGTIYGSVEFSTEDFDYRIHVYKYDRHDKPTQSNLINLRKESPCNQILAPLRDLPMIDFRLTTYDKDYDPFESFLAEHGHVDKFIYATHMHGGKLCSKTYDHVFDSSEKWLSVLYNDMEYLARRNILDKLCKQNPADDVDNRYQIYHQCHPTHSSAAAYDPIFIHYLNTLTPIPDDILTTKLHLELHITRFALRPYVDNEGFRTKLVRVKPTYVVTCNGAKFYPAK